MTPAERLRYAEEDAWLNAERRRAGMPVTAWEQLYEQHRADLLAVESDKTPLGIALVILILTLGMALVISL